MVEKKVVIPKKEDIIPEEKVQDGKGVRPTEKQQAPQPAFSAPLVGALANEIASIVVNRLPSMPYSFRRRRAKKKKINKIEHAVFLDTSAIIDGRIFDVLHLGLLHDTVVVPESILLELKHIADSQDTVKRERGRKGLEKLERLKKAKIVQVMIAPTEAGVHAVDVKKYKEVDEQLIAITKMNKGRVITCDYNLEKKATIEGVRAINMNALANTLKVTAVPGESLHIKVMHQGKDPTQGVGYLDDGTMIVVELGSQSVGKMLDVVVS